jgi:Tol biopolymer transport system component
VDESSPEHQPAVEEDATQKHEEVVTSFAGKVTNDCGEHAAGIKKCLDELHLAPSRRGATWFTDVFDARRTMRLLKQQGMLPTTWGGDNEYQVMRKLEPQLRQRLAHPVVGITWRRCEIRQVRFLQDETEAVVHSRHWDADDVPARVRLWLVRRDGKWRVYDFEELEVSMRFSTALGVGSMMVDQKNPSIKALPRLLQGCQEVVGGDSERGVEILEKLKGEKFPPVVESWRLAMIAEGWRDQKEYAKALKAADRAVAINNDLPFLHLTYARCHNGLKQHEKALEAADRYAKRLGKDAYYFAEVGDACAGLARTADAVAAYKSGLNDDPQSAVNVLGLMRLLPDGEHRALVQYYKQLKGLDEWFDAMAEEFIREKDAKTLRRLIEIHKSVVPDDERIPKYERPPTKTSDFEVGHAFLCRNPGVADRLPMPIQVFWRLVEPAAPAAEPVGNLPAETQFLGTLPTQVFEWVSSNDGCHLGGVSHRDGKLLVVLDGQEGPGYDGIGKGSLVFSPDGTRLAYQAKKGQKWLVVVDGRERSEYNGVGLPLFSPDGKRLAYAARKGPKWLMVEDENQGPEYDGIMEGSLAFSPDNKHLTYGARSGKRWRMVVDGREGAECDGIMQGAPVFSAEGGRLAYGARTGDKWRVVSDGQKGSEYDYLGKGSLSLSVDGKRVAYSAERQGKWLAVVDGQEGPEYDGIMQGTPVFSPDGRRVAYAAKKGRSWCVVVDGQEGLPYDGIGKNSPVFSRDGNRIAYLAVKGEKRLVVVDGQQDREYDEIDGLAFSPDGKRLAYGVRKDGMCRMVVDGQEGPEHARIRAPVFSADGKRLAYVAHQGEKDLVIVNGKKGPEYDEIVRGGPAFRQDGTLEYLAIQHGVLYRVRHRP